MDYETLHYGVSDGVATVRFDRPDAANAFNMQMGKDFMHAAIRCDSDPQVRAVVITGTGKMFCAGGDLAAFATFGENVGAALRELTGYLHMGISRLLRMDAPVVVAVNGVAAGGGFSVAMGGDLVLASDRARFTMAYTKAGLVPDGTSTFLLPRLVGLRRAQELIFENRILSAQEAADWGIVTRVVPADQLQQAAATLARQLAAGPTKSLGATKRLLLDSFSTPLETQAEFESRAIAAAAAGPDGQEGIKAFVEKRPPAFTGQG